MVRVEELLERFFRKEIYQDFFLQAETKISKWRIDVFS